MENTEKNWIEAMIEREAIPPSARLETTEKFLVDYGVSSSTYYYQARQQENLKKIVKLAINNAKKHAPEVLENLAERGKKNHNDAKIYLQFILQLEERMDLTSGGQSIFQILNYGHISKKDNTIALSVSAENIPTPDIAESGEIQSDSDASPVGEIQDDTEPANSKSGE